MPITWQQVAAPDLSASTEMMNQGANNLASAFKGINAAFDPIRKANAAVAQQETQNNTNSIVSALKNASTLDATKALVQGLDPNKLKETFGDRIDMGQVMAAKDQAVAGFMDRQNTDYQYAQNQIAQQEKPIIGDLEEQVAGIGSLEDFNARREGIIKQASSLTNGSPIMAALNQRGKDLQSKLDADVDRNNRLYLFGKQREDIQRKEGYSALYNGLLDAAQQGAAPAELSDLMVNSPEFKALSPDDQAKLKANVDSIYGENSPLIDTDEKQKLAELKNQEQAKAQSILTAFEQTIAPAKKMLEDGQKRYEYNPAGTVLDNVLKPLGKTSGEFSLDDVATMSENIERGREMGLTQIIKKDFANGRNVQGIQDVLGLTDEEITRISGLTKDGKGWPTVTPQAEEKLFKFVASTIKIPDEVAAAAARGNIDIDTFDPSNVEVLDGESVRREYLQYLKYLRTSNQIKARETESNVKYQNQLTDSTKVLTEALKDSVKRVKN